MALFTQAIDFVLKHEGGYVNNPADPGGETNFGISKRSYPNLDIKNLSQNQAKLIYMNDFWTPNNLTAINDQKIATKMFDMIVNMGRNRAVIIFQSVLDLTVNVLTVDGKIGPETISAINKTNSDTLMSQVVSKCESFYQGLVDADPNKEVFLKGWLARARDIPV